MANKPAKMFTSNCNVASIRVENPSTSTSFFTFWLEFLKPFHKLTSVEVRIMAVILQERFTLSKVITDVKILDRVVLGKETRKKLVETCHITANNLSVALASLRTKGVLTENSINMKYVPNITHDCKHYEMILSFNVNDSIKEQPKQGDM